MSYVSTEELWRMFRKHEANIASYNSESGLSGASAIMAKAIAEILVARESAK